MAYLGTEKGETATYEEVLYWDEPYPLGNNLFAINSSTQNVEKIELLEVRLLPDAVPANQLFVIHFAWKGNTLTNSIGNNYTPLSLVPLGDGSYRLEPNHPPIVYLNQGLHRQLSVPFSPQLRFSFSGSGVIPFVKVYYRFRITRFVSDSMERIAKFEPAILNVPT